MKCNLQSQCGTIEVLIFHVCSEKGPCPSAVEKRWHFVKFTGKQLCQSLFFLRPAILLRKGLQHMYVSANFAIFLRIPLYRTTSDDYFWQLFFSSSFFLFGFSFMNIHDSQDSRYRGRYFFYSSLPLPPTSQALRTYLGDNSR